MIVNKGDNQKENRMTDTLQLLNVTFNVYRLL